MNQFKVGDKVKIKDNIEREPYYLSGLPKSKVYTINAVGEYGGLLIEEIYCHMFIDPNIFELVQKEDTMTFLNEKKIKFKDLKDDEKLLIINNMDKLEYYSMGKWEELFGADTIIINSTYRIKPKQLNIPWEHIKPEFKYAAMDKNRNIYVYVERPYIIPNNSAWTHDFGDWDSIGVLKIDTHGVDWENSLVKRPD